MKPIKPTKSELLNKFSNLDVGPYIGRLVRSKCFILVGAGLLLLIIGILTARQSLFLFCNFLGAVFLGTLLVGLWMKAGRPNLLNKLTNPTQGQPVEGKIAAPLTGATQPAIQGSAEGTRMETFFFKVKEEEKGPYTAEQLRSMWQAGQITADAVCRSSISAEWFPLAGRISRLGEAVSASDTTSIPENPQRIPLFAKIPRLGKSGCAGVAIIALGILTFCMAGGCADQSVENMKAGGDQFQAFLQADSLARDLGYASYRDYELAGEQRGAFTMMGIGSLFLVWGYWKHRRKSSPQPTNL